MAPVLLIALFPWTARAEKDLTQDQVAAYVAVVKADLARDAGAIADARRLYREAQELYEAIAKKDARWHPEIIQFRLAYCKSQLEALRDRHEGERPAPSGAASTPDTATAEALERLTRIETENEELKSLRQSLENELASSSNRLADAQAERDRLAAERDALQQQLADATEAAKQMTATDEEAGRKLRQERDALQDALQAATKALDDQTRLAEITREEAGREIKALREAQAELEKQLAEAQAQLAKQPDELEADAKDPDAIQRELTRIRKTIEEAAAQLDASRDMAVKLLQAPPLPAQE